MKRKLLMLAGLFFIGLAYLGILLPGLPTTPFLIVAAACFAKSSPRLHGWLLNNKIFAPIIKNWQKNRSIPKKAKLISLLVILLVGTSSVILIENLYLKILVILLLLFPIVLISRLKVTENISRQV